MSVLQSQTYNRYERPGHRRLTAIIAALGGIILLITACTPPPSSSSDTPQITFSHLQPIRLNTRAAQIRRTFQPPLAAPHIEHTAPASPETVLMNWIRDRLKTTDAPAMLIVEILDASLIEKKLSRKGGLESTFKAQPVSRVTGRMEVNITIRADNGAIANAVVITQRSQVLHDNLTLAERDQKLLDFVEAMGQDLNQRMELEIHRHLRNFIAG